MIEWSSAGFIEGAVAEHFSLQQPRYLLNSRSNSVLIRQGSRVCSCTVGHRAWGFQTLCVCVFTSTRKQTPTVHQFLAFLSTLSSLVNLLLKVDSIGADHEGSQCSTCSIGYHDARTCGSHQVTTSHSCRYITSCVTIVFPDTETHGKSIS